MSEYRQKLSIQLASLLLIVIGCLVFADWLFNIAFLKSLIPGLSVMKANTALGSVFTGITLWLLRTELPGNRQRQLARLAAIAVFLLGFLTFSEYLFDWNLGIDQLLFKDPDTRLYPGRMAEATALGLGLLGLSLWLLTDSRRYWLVQGFALIVTGIGMLALVGYLYGATALYGVFAFTAIAPSSAATLLIGGLGVLIARPRHGLMATLSSDAPGGAIARRLLPAVVLVPIMVGWLRLKGQQQGLYGTEFGLALFASSNILIFAVVLWWNARSLNQAEARLRRLSRTLAVLSDVNQIIVRTRQLPVLFDQVCRVAIQKGDFQLAWIGVLDETNSKINLVAQAGSRMGSWTGSADPYLEKLDLNIIDGGSFEANALFSAIPVVINDLENDPHPVVLREIVLQQGYRAVAAFPLMVGGEVRGVLSLYTRTIGFFDQAELRLLSELAEDIAFAMEFAERDQQRRQAEAASQRYARRMEVLHQIDLGLISGGSVQAVVEVALDHLRQLIPCQRADVTVLDKPANESVIFAVGVDGDTRLTQGVRVPFHPGMFEGYDERHIQLFDDIRLFQDSRPRARQLVNEGLLSALSVILMDQDQPLGRLGLFATTAGFFTEEYQQIAVEVADQLAIAIRQMHLAEALTAHSAQLDQKIVALTLTEDALKRYAQRMEILHQIDTGMIEAKSLETLVEVVLKKLRVLVAFDRARLALIDGQQAEVIVFAVDEKVSILGPGTRVPLPPGMLDGFDAGKVRVIDDLEVANEKTPIYGALLQEGLLSSLQALLVGPTGPVGILAVAVKVQGFFTVEHQEIMAEIASQLAIAVHQRQLSQELERHMTLLEQRVSERTTELQTAKESVEAILSNSADGILLVGADFTIQQTNPAFIRLFACEPGDYPGQSLTALLDAAGNELTTTTIQSGVTEGQIVNLEVRAGRRDQTGFDAELRIGFINQGGFVCSIRDITERKAQERQLRYHASLQENVSDAVIVTDLEFRIQSWNRAAERIYGWTAEEVTGKPVAEILRTEVSTPDERERNRRQLREQGWWQGEVIQRHKDGSIRYILGSATLVRDESGQPFSVVSVNHDITERKQTEEVLRQSEERFSLVFRLSPVAIGLTTAAEGRYLDVNDGLLKLLGYSRDEMIGRTANELNVWETPGQRLAAVQAIREQGSVRGLEARFRTKTGEIRTTLTSIEPVMLNGQSCFLSIIYDISERKTAEETLRESEEKFRLLMDAAPVAIVITNHLGHITLVNNQAEKAFGYHRTELVGQSVDILLPDSTRDRHASKRATYMATPRVRQMGIGLELSARRKDGSEFPVEIELSYIETQAGLLVMSFILDITERRRITAELEQQRTFLQQVIDVSPSMIFVKDYESRFVLVNPMVARMYNTTVEALLGKSTAIFNSNPAEVASFLEADRRVITSGEPLFVEEPVTDASGETHWFQTTKVPIISADGKSKYVLGVATDITERKKSEATLQQAFEKEKELGELKSRFVSMASHEFRTPLATILAISETLSAYRHKMSEEQIDGRFDKIKDQVNHLKAIMDDMLLLAKMQARRGEFNPVRLDLDNLCRSVLDEFQSQPDITQHLDYTCHTTLREVILDRKLMRQVISNLVSNAIKYSPGASTVKIVLEYEEGFLNLKVSDQGIGIPEADLAHLFEPFHRATNVGTISGTGLGLVITKESIELHGGTIVVESQVGVGTTFIARIPVVIEEGHGTDQHPDSD